MTEKKEEPVWLSDEEGPKGGWDWYSLQNTTCNLCDERMNVKEWIPHLKEKHPDSAEESLSTLWKNYINYHNDIEAYKEALEKEKEKSLRLQADYQNLEKQTIDRINTRGDKIILDFLTVYEDFIRTKDAYEKEGGNVDSLNGIIKNMKPSLKS